MLRENLTNYLDKKIWGVCACYGMGPLALFEKITDYVTNRLEMASKETLHVSRAKEAVSAHLATRIVLNIEI